MYFRPFWAFLLLLSSTYSAALADDPTSDSKSWGGIAPALSENECRTFIEAALKEQRTQGDTGGDEVITEEASSKTETDQSEEDQVTEETNDEGVTEDAGSKVSEDIMTAEAESEEASLPETENAQQDSTENADASAEVSSAEIVDDSPVEAAVTDVEPEEPEESIENQSDVDNAEGVEATNQEISEEGGEQTESSEKTDETEKTQEDSVEDETSPAAEESNEQESTEEPTEQENEMQADEASTENEEIEGTGDKADETESAAEESQEVEETQVDETSGTEDVSTQSEENVEPEETSVEQEEGQDKSSELAAEPTETDATSVEETEKDQVSEEQVNVEEPSSIEESPSETTTPVEEGTTESTEEEQPEVENTESKQEAESAEQSSNEEKQPTETSEQNEASASVETENSIESTNETVSEQEAEVEATPEESPEQEDLTLRIEIPDNLRSRAHISEVLRLDRDSVDIEAKLLRTEETTLRELKRIYEAAIKPLEILYKYRDLSNRHFGDPEIFSKPLILFMGPWSGGKSTIINYLLENEYKSTALRTGAEPSPAYFNIVMWGERQEILDGTQLAADWTFSGLQKFGQGLLDRLRGLKMDHPLLEKVNIVEIPGILEIRKQVERLFPFNDACQWFIDRADIIFLVYDPAKLDAGPETEAILDQLKGREYQTKIILNKADQVKPEELMRVQGTLIWNISPLMSSMEPPVMYSTSLWSHPYQTGAPSRLLFAQEKAFLKDLREAIDKRVENKISSARRFAVRVRNHAKMVDCYLTTYYNHKTFFGNKQKVSDDIIEHPQNYHIYEGLSTLTNISRYDLPDPDVYRDFFRLNPVYDFQQLSSTCTYFKGCPINRLDVAIAYDLPELVGKYKKQAEEILKISSSRGGK